MLNIFYGRDGLDKEKFIFDRIDPKGRALLIVPDQFTLEAERRLFEHLGVEALMDVEVLSLSRLGFRLLSELGGAKKTFIDKYGRHMLLSKIAAEQGENLQVFRGIETKNSFIELLNNFISELKQYNCGSADLAKLSEKAEAGSYMEKKLKDMQLLYGLYEEAIAGKYTDSEDRIDLYLSKISSSQLIKDNNIWIYGFDSLAPKHLSIIGELMTVAKDVNVVITASRSEADRDGELFSLTETVIYKLGKTAEARGVEWKTLPIGLEYENTSRKNILRHVEKNLYALPFEKYQGDDEEGCLTLVGAANPYNEAESAAAYILSLVRDQGYRYRDIQLICNDQELRGHILHRIFREYDIEIFSDGSRDIMQNPIIQYVLCLMEGIITNYRTDTVIGSLKTGFGDLSHDEVTDLENYAIKYRIRYNMWKKPFGKGEKEYGLEELARLNSLRERAVKPFLALEPIFNRESNGEFLEGFYNFLYEEVKLPEKITQFAKLQEEAGNLDLAGDAEQIWESLIGILDQIKAILGNEKLDGENFAALVKTGLSQVTIGVLPPAQDGLMMGTTQRTRTGSVRALVVVGANEGILPAERAQEGIFQGDEKDIFKDRGVELCKVDSVMVQEERLGIYRTLSKPTEKLYVSYSKADTEGNGDKASGIFLRLLEMFPKKEEMGDILNVADDRALINSGLGGLRHLTEKLQAIAEGENIPKPWLEMMNWYKAENPEALEGIRRGIGFTNKEKAMGEEKAKNLYIKEGEKDMTLSASRVETYSRCPFSFFVGYGLKPEERRVFEVAPREIGDIYHRCLRRLSEKLTVEGMQLTHEESPWMTVDRDACDGYVDEILREEMETYKEGLLSLGNEELYRSRRLADICKRVCWHMIQQVRAGTVTRAEFEVNFGRGKKIKPIEIELASGKLYIEGQIDRVDLLENDRVKIIDYKTGSESFKRDEAEQGYRLQLMLYLRAAMEEEKKPAGVFYFSIAENRENLSGKDASDPKNLPDMKKSFQLNGVMVNNDMVIKNIAGEFKDSSDVVSLKRKTDGSLSKASEKILLSEEDFAKMEDAVADKVTEICQNLMAGKLETHPMKTEYTSACRYCRYKGICLFDTRFEGCEYNIIRSSKTKGSEEPE